MRIKVILFALLLSAGIFIYGPIIRAQSILYTSPVGVVTPAPSGYCASGSGYPILVDVNTGGIYSCSSGQWRGPLGSGSGGITQLIGDVTAGPGNGSQSAILATVNGAPGTCGDATDVCQMTTNAKGLVTSQSQVPITGADFTAAGDLAGTNTSQEVVGLESIPLPTLAASTGYLKDTDGVLSLSAGNTASGIIPYLCVGSLGPGGDDVSNINSILAGGTGVYIYVYGNSCLVDTADITLNSFQTFDARNATISTNRANTSTLQGALSNAAHKTPTTYSISCTLTAGSTTVTGCTGHSFVTNAPISDVDQTIQFTGALGNDIDMFSTIANVTSSSSFVMTEAVPSFVSTGTFSGTEIVRDHDIDVYLGIVNNAATGGGYTQTLVFDNCNRCRILSGTLSNTVANGSWHLTFANVENSGARDVKGFSYSGFGQDVIDFEGNWHNVFAEDITSDASDDAVAMKNGETWELAVTTGGGSGVYVSNLQGAGGSGGFRSYTSCLNSTGTTCSGLPQTNMIVNGITCQSIITTAGIPGGCFGVAAAFFVGDNPNSVAMPSSPPLLDNVVIRDVSGFSASSTGSPITIGINGNFNQYYGNFTFENIANNPGAPHGGNGTINVEVPASGSFSTNVASITIRDPAYNPTQSASAPLFNMTGGSTNGLVSAFSTDNPYLANFNFGGAFPNAQFPLIVAPFTQLQYCGSLTWAASSAGQTATCAGYLSSRVLTSCIDDWQNVAGPSYQQQLNSGGNGTVEIFPSTTVSGILNLWCK